MKTTKKLETIEKALKINANPEGFFVLLRRKRKWILNTLGHPVGMVTQGEPSKRDLTLIVPTEILGPFKNRQEAESIMEAEVAKMKQQDPTRFASLGEMHRMIIPHPDDFPEVKNI